MLRNFKKSIVVAVAACGLALATVPMNLYADDHGDCERRIERAQAKLDEAVQKHGDRSHEADERRQRLNAERERCWSKYHGWWDPQERHWHTDHDWDNH